jgi:hypothetical protein
MWGAKKDDACRGAEQGGYSRVPVVDTVLESPAESLSLTVSHQLNNIGRASTYIFDH